MPQHPLVKTLAEDPQVSRITLPVFDGIAKRSRGRDLAAGYARGWGLEFGDLRDQVGNDPLYQSACALAQHRTLVAETKRMNIYLILRFGFTHLPPGHIVEFGTYRGGNAIFMAKVCQELHPGVRVYALDTFEGMPPTDPTHDAHGPGDFKDAGYPELATAVKDFGLDNLVLVRGRFEDTAEAALKEMSSVRLAHIDCDIYSAVAYSYRASKPYMVDGGYWVFDDPLYSSCIGAMEAVEEHVIQADGKFAEQTFPHLVYRSRR